MNLVELSEIARSFVALIPITRPIIFFDTESTGPNPTQDRIVELGFVQIKPDGTVKEWRTLMRPGMLIPREASHGNGSTYEGHGITDDMVNSCRVCGVPSEIHHVTTSLEMHDFAPWPTFGDLASNLHKGFSGSDFGGYNIKHFDLPLVQEEFKRHGFPLWSYDDACIVDSFRIWQILKPRTLTDAMREFLNETHAGAHSAVDDVRASLRIAITQIETSQLPRDLRGLHDAQFPRDPNAVDPEGRFVWKDGIVVVNFGKKWKGVRLDLMTRRDLDWIANKAEVMSPTARQIARDAMAGKFPTRE